MGKILKETGKITEQYFILRASRFSTTSLQNDQYIIQFFFNI